MFVNNKKIVKLVPQEVTRCQILRLKCTKIAFRPRPRCGKLTALPRPLAILKEPTSKESEGKGRGGERGEEGKVKEREVERGGGRDLTHPKTGVAPPMYNTTQHTRYLDTKSMRDRSNIMPTHSKTNDICRISWHRYQRPWVRS